MMKNGIDQFAAFAMELDALKSLRGGLCGCKAAAPYACSAAGFQPGSGGFANCMGDVYTDCETLLPQECAIP